MATDENGFLDQRYNYPPPPLPNAKHNELFAFDGGEERLTDEPTPEAASAKAIELGNLARVKVGEDIVNSDFPPNEKLAQLDSLVARHETDDNADATVGLVQSLANKTNDVVPDVLASRQGLLKRQQANLSFIKEQYAQAETSLQSKNGALRALGSKYNQLDILASTARAFFASTSTIVNLVEIAQKYVPNANWTNYTDSASLLNQFNREFRNLPEEDVRKAVPEIISLVKKSTVLGTDNPVDKSRLLESLLGAGFDDTHGTGTNILHGLSLISPIFAVTPGVKGAIAGVDAVKNLPKTISEAALKVGQQAGRVIGEAPTEFRGAEETIAAAQNARTVAAPEVYEAAVSNRVKDTYGKQYRNAAITKDNEGYVSTVDLGPKPNNGYATEEYAQNLAADKYPGATVVEKDGQFYIRRVDRHSLDDLIPEVPSVVGSPTPAIAVGTTADAATLTRAGASLVAGQLLTETGEATLSKLGTTPEAAIGSLELPKFTNDLDQLGHPYAGSYWWNEEVANSVSSRVKQGLESVLHTRLKDTFFTSVEKGKLEYTTRIGSASGKGYATEEYATNLANDQFGAGNFEIVKAELIGDEAGKTPEYFIQIKGLADAGVNDVRFQGSLLSKPGASVTRVFGREAAYTEEYNRALSAANRRTNVASEKANAAISGYFKLGSKRRAAVNDILDSQRSDKKWYTDEELRARGLDEEQVSAVKGYKQLADYDYFATDFNIREQFKAAGVKFSKALDKTFGSFLRPVDEAPKSAKIYDLGTGKESTFEKGDQLFELVEPAKNGATHGVIKANSKVALEELPVRVTAQQPGYVLTRYKYPYYVRNITDNKFEVGAGSLLQSDTAIAKLQAENPGKTFKRFLAQEVDGQSKATLSDDLSRVKNEGLLITSRKRPDPLLGVDGKQRIISVEEAIKATTRRFVNSAGLDRFTSLTLRDLNRRVARFNVKFSLGVEPTDLSGQTLTQVGGRLSIEDLAIYNDAKNVFAQLELLNGTSKSGTVPALNSARVKIGGLLYNAADRVDALPKLPGGFKDSSVIRYLADDVIGLESKTRNGLKTAAFFSFLGARAFRNIFTQTGAIPTYAALKGVGRYALSGEFSYDVGNLTLNVLRGTQPEKGDAKILFDVWQRGQFQQGIKRHILLSQTVFDGNLSIAGRLDDSVGVALRGLQAAGFNAGTTLDKISSVVAATKAWRVKNGGRIPKTEADIDDIVYQADALTLHQDVTDPLPTQNGQLGFLTQFAGYNIKASNRLLGSVTGLSTEGPWSSTERVRFALASTLTYGFDGLRLGAIYDQLEANSKEKFDPRLRQLFHQGIYGSLLNMTAKATTGSDNQTFADFSGSVGPFNFAGPSLQTLTSLFDVTVSAVGSGGFKVAGEGYLGVLGGIAESAPGFNLLGKIGDVVEFGNVLVGNFDLPLADVAQATTVAFLRRFPLSSDLIKGYAIATTGFSIDTRGNPIAPASMSDALFALAGITTNNAEDLNALERKVYGSGGISEDGLNGALQREAKEKAKIFVEAMNNLPEGKFTSTRIIELARDHAIAFKSLLSGPQQGQYFTAFVNELRKAKIPQNEKFIASFIGQLRSGKLTLDGNLSDAIRASNFTGSETLGRFVDEQQDVKPIYDLLKRDEDGN